MTGADVLDVLDVLAAAGAEPWLDGGWGVDALLGEQTRPHSDLDLVLDSDQLDHALAALAAAGFAVSEDELPTRVLLLDDTGRGVDIHPVRFDAEGGGFQAQPDGSDFRYPPAGLAGCGIVSGREVRCLTPELQLICHLGYEPDANDFHDMRLLAERFGLELPSPYATPIPS